MTKINSMSNPPRKMGPVILFEDDIGTFVEYDQRTKSITRIDHLGDTPWDELEYDGWRYANINILKVDWFSGDGVWDQIASINRFRMCAGGTKRWGIWSTYIGSAQINFGRTDSIEAAKQACIDAINEIDKPRIK